MNNGHSSVDNMHIDNLDPELDLDDDMDLRSDEYEMLNVHDQQHHRNTANRLHHQQFSYNKSLQPRRQQQQPFLEGNNSPASRRNANFTSTAIAYSRALRSAQQQHHSRRETNSSSGDPFKDHHYHDPDDIPPLYGQYSQNAGNTTRLTLRGSSSSSSKILPNNTSSSSASSSTNTIVTNSTATSSGNNTSGTTTAAAVGVHYETLSRVKGHLNHASVSSSQSPHDSVSSSSASGVSNNIASANNKINNHHLLSNNLLSSSVRDLLSTSLHPNHNNHESSSTLVDTTITAGRSAATLSRGDHLRDYDSPTATTCLVRTQSGSRFMFSTEMADSALGADAAGIIGSAPNSSVLMRGPGITTSRTVGSKATRAGIIGSTSSSSQHHPFHANFQSSLNPGFSGTFTSFHSRFGKSFTSITSCNWKCTAIISMILCVMLFLSLIYALMSTHGSCASECSCPVMIEDNSLSHSQDRTDAQPHHHSHNNGLSISCPVLCSGKGQYVKGLCVCSPGWKGRECSIREQDCEVANCSGHGSCFNGNCQCHPGFKGTSCEVEHCPTLCSGKGAYIGGQCVCQPGFKGRECHLRNDQCDPKDCNGHGVCVDGECVCKPGWKGLGCSLSANECEVRDCHGRGVCQSGSCKCKSGFKGKHCESEDCVDPSCSGHGVCFDKKCLCKPGWKGDNCSLVDNRLSKFFPNCSFHGVYDIETERCSCFSGYSGDNCSLGEYSRLCSCHVTLYPALYHVLHHWEDGMLLSILLLCVHILWRDTLE